MNKYELTVIASMKRYYNPLEYSQGFSLTPKQFDKAINLLNSLSVPSNCYTIDKTGLRYYHLYWIVDGNQDTTTADK